MSPADEGWRREGLVWYPPPNLVSTDEPDPEDAIRPKGDEVRGPAAAALEEEGRTTRPCGRCGRPVWRRSKLCTDCRDVIKGIAEDYMTQEDRLWETLARTLAVPLPPTSPLGATCACGCLLTTTDELCPACVIPWMRANDVVPDAMARDMDNEFYYRTFRPQRRKSAA